LQDRLGPGYTLLRLGATGEDAPALQRSFAAYDAPFDVLDVADDAARDVYGYDLMLLRPDLHVVCRSNPLPVEADQLTATATAPPAAHTLLLTATSFATNPALIGALPFDPVKDFTPVVLLATGALGVYVNPEVPAKSMREFVDLVRRQPGKLYYSSPGNGGPQHLAMEFLKLETGMDIIHVPYKGAGGAIADLVGGHVQAMISALQTVAPHVQSGRLRMLAVLSAQRSPAFADVPTLKE